MDALVAAVDLGGSSLKGALVDRAGRVVHRSRRATPHEAGADAVVQALATFAAELVAQGRRRDAAVTGVGVAVPGIVDEATGTAILSANLGWRDLPLRAELAARLGLPVAFGHDVRAGGLAEVRLGAARGAEDVVVVPIGTGIAAAVLVGGRPVVGGGYAGELGHVVVDPSGDPCRCGSRGCLEAVASAAAIARRYRARSGRTADGAADVARRVADGDPDACAVWNEAIGFLADALATCVSLLAPEVVVVGGGLARSGDLLLAPLRAALDARLSFQRMPRLVRAALGDEAGCVGAALLAMEATA
ncbi:ROK family protein [Pseudonocardia nigra]|uniref:ROK family protein n=1 Tax=Pseudonocardia nigra TaxID=1921578 RepID=UPI001C5DB241|nr:ROK family protein [Pseudonocardia nigra]